MERYRIVEGLGLYFITYTVVEWLPVFVTEEACKVVTNALNYCIRERSLRVSAYVLMPTHLHAIVFDREFDPVRLKHTLDNVRKFTGRELADLCIQSMPAAFTEVFRQNASGDRQRRIWQPSQHPVGILSENVWKQKMDYLHMNPSRKGLCRAPEDWRFSSAAFWLKGVLENDVNLAEAIW